MKLDLYVGIPTSVNEEKTQKVIDTVNTRHPDGSLVAVVDGYWSGVEESTLHIKVESELGFAQETAEIIKQYVPNGFVALSDAEDD